MSLSRLARLALVPALLAAVAFTAPNDAYSQKKPKKEPPAGRPTNCSSRSRGRSGRTCRRASCRWSSSRASGSRSSATRTAERMNLFGHFEALLHTPLPGQGTGRPQLRPPGRRGRPSASGPADYTKLDDPLYAFGPDTFLCFFGFNESFAGPDGVEKFKADYEKFLDEYAAKYPRDDAESRSRGSCWSRRSRSSRPATRSCRTATKENANLKLYADAVKAVADEAEAGVRGPVRPDADGCSPREPGMQFTINGCHVNEAGDRVVGRAARHGAVRRRRTRRRRRPRSSRSCGPRSTTSRGSTSRTTGWSTAGTSTAAGGPTTPRRSPASTSRSATWPPSATATSGTSPRASRSPRSRTTARPASCSPRRPGSATRGRSTPRPRQLRYLSPDEFIKTLHRPAGLRDQAVRRRDEVPGAGQAGAAQLRQQGPAVGGVHAELPAVEARRPEAERQAR